MGADGPTLHHESHHVGRKPMSSAYEGVVQHIYIDEDGGEWVRDITHEVNQLASKIDKAEKDRDEARNELADFRNKRHWEEAKIVRDDKTGLSAVVITTYRLRAEHIRLDWDPLNMRYPSRS